MNRTNMGIPQKTEPKEKKERKHRDVDPIIAARRALNEASGAVARLAPYAARHTEAQSTETNARAALLTLLEAESKALQS